MQQSTAILTLAANAWAVTFGTARRGLGGLRVIIIIIIIVAYLDQMARDLMACL